MFPLRMDMSRGSAITAKLDDSTVMERLNKKTHPLLTALFPDGIDGSYRLCLVDSAVNK